MDRKIQNSNDVTKLLFFFLIYFGIYYCNVLFMSSSRNDRSDVSYLFLEHWTLIVFLYNEIKKLVESGLASDRLDCNHAVHYAKSFI